MKKLKQATLSLAGLAFTILAGANSAEVAAQQVLLTNVSNVYRVTAPGLNVRACPQLDCPILFRLTGGQAVSRIGRTGNWLYILRNGKGAGYADRRYLRGQAAFSGVVSGVTAAAPQTIVPLVFNAGVSNIYRVTTRNLNVRACPQLNCPILFKLEGGQSVTGLGRSGNWLYLMRNGKGSGYADQRYLRTQAAFSGVASTATNTVPQTVKALPRTVYVNQPVVRNRTVYIDQPVVVRRPVYIDQPVVQTRSINLSADRGVGGLSCRKLQQQCRTTYGLDFGARDRCIKNVQCAPSSPQFVWTGLDN